MQPDMVFFCPKLNTLWVKLLCMPIPLLSAFESHPGSLRSMQGLTEQGRKSEKDSKLKNYAPSPFHSL